MFLIHILLTAIWIALTKELSIGNLTGGFILVYAILYIIEPALDLDTSYRLTSRKVVAFLLFFLWELILASWRVFIVVLSPRMNLCPGIVAIPLDITTDVEITLLANLITLTPGTLSLDVSKDRKILYVHVMNIDNGDVAQFRQQIKDGFERRIQEVFA